MLTDFRNLYCGQKNNRLAPYPLELVPPGNPAFATADSGKCKLAVIYLQTAVDSAIGMNDQAIMVDLLNILNQKA